MSSVRERTQKEIMDYIRTHSKNGKLTKSLLDIAEDIGYSNATVHRALQALEEKGIVEINKADKPTQPNTIIFSGEKNEIDELVARGVQLMKGFSDLQSQFEEFMDEVSWTVRKLQREAREQKTIANRIVSIQDIPDSDLQVVTMKKEAQ